MEKTQKLASKRLIMSLSLQVGLIFSFISFCNTTEHKRGVRVVRNSDDEAEMRAARLDCDPRGISGKSSGGGSRYVTPDIAARFLSAVLSRVSADCSAEREQSVALCLAKKPLSSGFRMSLSFKVSAKLSHRGLLLLEVLVKKL